MGVRWYEWKKLMYHSGGLLIVATFVLLEVFRLIISYGSGLSEDRRYRTSYEQYLSCVVGKVDGETARFFLKETRNSVGRKACCRQSTKDILWEN